MYKNTNNFFYIVMNIAEVIRSKTINPERIAAIKAFL